MSCKNLISTDLSKKLISNVFNFVRVGIVIMQLSMIVNIKINFNDIFLCFVCILVI